MLKKIGLGLVVLVVGFLGLVAFQPSSYQITRSATISAPASEVFALVNNFQKWGEWSPWAKLDPAAKNTFEGPSEGVGAIFKWAGNKEVGVGSMTILESKPNDLIRIKLDFVKPFEDTSTTEFTFKSEGNQTKVIWNMFGENNFTAKAFCLFMNMDKMIGEKFEEGLASMKGVVEGKKKD